MTNFKDFETVLEAANKELNNLKSKSKEIQQEIDTIDQDRYQAVFDYFNNLAQIIKRNKICTNILYIPTSMKTIHGDYYVIRIHQNSAYYPEIAIHTSSTPNTYYDFSIHNGDLQYKWVRWMELHANYQKALSGARDDNHPSYRHSVESFFNDLVDHFEEYEPEISANFKEAVTQQVANNLEEAEAEIWKGIATLINK